MESLVRPRVKSPNSRSVDNLKKIPSISSFQSDSSVEDAPVKHVGNRLYISDTVWEGVAEEYVNSLPRNINGTKIYILPYDKSKPMDITSSDGRRWQRYRTSNKRIAADVRRVTDCDGMWICRNLNCEFHQEHQRGNSADKTKDNRCVHCMSTMHKVKCNARKIIEINKITQETKVFHYGNHSCTPKGRQPKPNKESLKKSFISNTKLKPMERCIHAVINAIETDKSISEIDNVAEEFTNTQFVRDAKKEAMKERRPHGHSIEAVDKLKSRMDAMDCNLIWKVVNTDESNYVITSSRLKAKIASDMNRNGKHFMAKEYAFIDGTRSTCSGYTELTISVYHPLLRRTIKLCSMFCAGENSVNIKTMVSSMDDLVNATTGAKFDPIGFVSDEGGAIQKGLVDFHGHEVKERLKACDFHFYQDRNRYAKFCTSSAAKERFKHLTEKWKCVVTPAHYKKALEELDEFIGEKPEKRGPIKGFIKFWDNRKVRFAACYRPLFNAPGASKAETVNAVTVNAGGKSLALVDAVMHDVASSILLKKEYERQHQQIPTVGRGPTAAELTAREEQSQVARAELGASSILELEGMDVDMETREEAIERYTVDPRSSHRSDKKNKKRQVADSGTSSDEEPINKRSKKTRNVRAAPFRGTRSIQFNDSLEKALCEGMTVSNYEKGPLEIKMEVSSSARNTYRVVINKSPSCSCPYKIGKPREVCKHTIWAFLNVLGCHRDDPLINQIALTEAEIPCAVFYSRGNSV